MTNKTANEIRKTFLDYFASKGHTIVPSAPLIPAGDPTLLFTNAGMVQFKNTFLGIEPRGYNRAASSQKCLRVSGKHNDFENVGRTARHHTFFEMLGNFSFGDYFKEEAIGFGWELLIKVLAIDPGRLWISVFRDDDEAFDIWTKKIAVPSDRVVRLGEKDNFWAMGDIGPCGPCSEILFDQGEKTGCGRPDCKVGCDCDRFLEIWNLVFMQYNRDQDGNLTPLPKPSIDTGMGLERITAVCQGVTSNYDTDLFKPLLRTAEEVTGKAYGSGGEDDVALRVLTDHARAAAFLIADGILPSNEGRGYVLKRVIRRAIRFGTQLGMNEPFFFRIADRVVDLMANPYRELERSRTSIVKILKVEEERFGRTLSAGVTLLQDEIETLRKKDRKVFPGKTIFSLYDTYGFPPDLTRELVAEAGLTFDDEGYQREMDRQRAMARAAREGESGAEIPPLYRRLAEKKISGFVGYETLEAETTVKTILVKDRELAEAGEGGEIDLVLETTPFYAESGGQIGDRGTVVGPDGEGVVVDTISPLPGLILHRTKVVRGKLTAGEKVTAAVDTDRRGDTARNHTATHLLQAALRQVLGDHVHQSGSSVAPDRLRFDFTHFAAPSPEEMEVVESGVNRFIRDNTALDIEEMEYQQALEIGATALFEEKYGHRVRVVRVPGVSIELCGGTHVARTGDIGLFKLVSEGGISSGVRRIEAVTGRGAMEEIHRLETILKGTATRLKAPVEDLPPRIDRLVENLKAAERDRDELRRRLALGASEKVSRVSIGEIEVLTQEVPDAGVKELRPLADQLRGNGNRVVVLGGRKNGKASLVSSIDTALTSKISATDVISPLALVVEGRGGGRSDFAQAGGPRGDLIKKALDQVPEVVKNLMGGGGIKGTAPPSDRS